MLWRKHLLTAKYSGTNNTGVIRGENKYHDGIDR